MSIDFEKVIKEHMEAQPWSIECDSCGNNLEIAHREVDADGDLYLKIEPCKTCIEAAKEDKG